MTETAEPAKIIFLGSCNVPQPYFHEQIDLLPKKTVVIRLRALEQHQQMETDGITSEQPSFTWYRDVWFSGRGTQI